LEEGEDGARDRVDDGGGEEDWGGEGGEFEEGNFVGLELDVVDLERLLGLVSAGLEQVSDGHVYYQCICSTGAFIQLEKSSAISVM
jgi:hypothetical protein